MSGTSKALRVLLLSTVVVALSSSSVSARTFYVRKSGNDRSAGTSAATAFKTLTRAFRERLASGDTIYIGAGTYSERMRVRPFAAVPVSVGSGITGGLVLRPLRVVADLTGRFTGDRGNVLVAAPNRWAATVPLNSSVQFEGIVFGPSQPGKRYYGIYANGLTASVSLVNCTFRNLHHGVLVRTGNLTASNCLFTSTKHGVYGAKAARCILDKCRFENATSIAAVLHANESLVQNCLIDQAKYGLHVRGFGVEPKVTINGLNVSNCTYGFYGVKSAVAMDGENSRFIDCRYDIYLADCDSEISGIIVDKPSQRPLTLNRGTAVVRGMDIVSSRHHGIYAVNMDGLSISQSRFGKTPRWAVYAHGTKLSVTASEFDGADRGLFVRALNGRTTPELTSLKFSNCSKVGIQIVSSTVALSENSKLEFSRCGYAVGLIGCTSTIRGLKLSSSKIPLYLKGGTCTLERVTISNAGKYGMLANQMAGFSGTGLTCTGAKSWGFYGSGNNVSLSDSKVSGNGHGVYFDGQGINDISLENVELRGNSGHGLHVRNASFHVPKGARLRIVENGGAGIHVRGSAIDLSGGFGIEISNNRIGLYANRTNVRLSGFRLSGNRFGVLQYHGELECHRSTISGGKYGVYQFHSPVCVLDQTDVTGTSSWGVVLNNAEAASQRVTVKDCQINGCGGGLSAKMPHDAELTMTSSSIADNRSHGVHSWRATARLTETNIFRNGGYGVLHYDGELDVSESAIQHNRRLGLLVYGYQNPAAARMVARRNRVIGNGGGVYAYRVDRAAIINNISARNRTYGVAVNVNGQGNAEVWNNSIVDNRHGVWHQRGKASICNNIIANGDLNASNTNSFGIYSDSGGAALNHNLLFGQKKKYVNTTPGTGDVIKPPRFVDYANGNYRLASGSPAINAGTSAGRLAATDIDGLSRPMFDAYEIGAYEYAEKSGSVRILNWGELAEPPRPVTRDGKSR